MYNGPRRKRVRGEVLSVKTKGSKSEEIKGAISCLTPRSERAEEKGQSELRSQKRWGGDKKTDANSCS